MIRIFLTAWFVIACKIVALIIRRKHFESAIIADLQYNVRRTAAITTPSTASVNYGQPVMHAYFDALGLEEDTMSSAGMSDTAHALLLRVWEEAWQRAGWQTRILTLKDAAKHKEFGRYFKKIQDFDTDDYNRACYFRWMAMSAIGGGWMSDYDTFPLHNFTEEGVNLPSQGLFTCYDRHVPCLLSGSASEWHRIFKQLVEYAIENPGSVRGRTPSDMRGLFALQTKYPDLFKSEKQIAPRKAILVEGNQWNKNHCENWTPTNARVIHFSHKALLQDWIPIHTNTSMDDRPSVAKRWLDDWLTHCGQRKFEVVNISDSRRKNI